MKIIQSQQCKVVTSIDCPDEWRSTNDYDSHKNLLYLALTKTEKVVVEFGCGFGSTPFIKQYCDNIHREFISLDTDILWAVKFKDTVVIDSYANYVNDDIGLLFIDGKPGEERKDRLLQFMPLATVLIAHDTQESANYCYQMKENLSKFKYRIDFAPNNLPNTTAVSNFIDLTKWV